MKDLKTKRDPKEWIAKAGTEDAKKYGRAKTEEEKQHLSVNSPKFWKGKTRNEETKAKISKTKQERGWSDKQKLICKKVYKIDKLSNEIIKTFDTTVLAAIDAKINQSTMSRWCMKNKVIDYILWSYEYVEYNKPV